MHSEPYSYYNNYSTADSVIEDLVYQEEVNALIVSYLVFAQVVVYM